MKFEEKTLIKNLFNQLKKVEEKYPNRNKLADELIANLVKNQPNSVYYITQTILIQEMAIKKLNNKIIALENKISELESIINKKEPSFLSSLFGNRSSDNFQKSQSGYLDRSVPMNNSNIDSTGGTLNNWSKNSGSSFISSALQTATGVAGGMIVGNMLMNLFHKDKPQEEIFNSIQEDTNFSSLDDFNFNNNQFLVSKEENLDSNNFDNNYTSNDVLDINDEYTICNKNEDSLSDNDIEDDSNYI